MIKNHSSFYLLIPIKSTTIHHPISQVITYTLLVGSFPFAGRDGDTAMLQRISAGTSPETEGWCCQGHGGASTDGESMVDMDSIWLINGKKLKIMIDEGLIHGFYTCLMVKVEYTWFMIIH